MKKLIGLLAALTMALGAAACGADAGETAASAGDGTTEAVNVHGDWKIDVVDPDGSTVDTIEFRNEFEGERVLSGLLAGGFSVEGWRIQIFAGGEVEICPSDDFCTAEAEATRRTEQSVVVTADFEPTGGGDIEFVSAQVLTDDPDSFGSYDAFSTKDLRSAEGGPGVVPVEAGQIVQVEVTYTFG